MLIKVCGVAGPTAADDLAMLAGAGAQLVGLWHGVPGGDADLSRDELARLAAVAREHALEPVVVTFARDPEALAAAVRASGARSVQLHGFELPGTVARIAAALRPVGAAVVKVLHVRGRACPELPLTAAYERAGVDAFVLDATAPDGRVGSTGLTIPPEVAGPIAGRLHRPFLLAGGITPAVRPAYAALARHPGFTGIDVSTGARDPHGRLSRERVEALAHAWREEDRVALR